MKNPIEVYQNLTTIMINERNQKMCIASRFDSTNCVAKLIGSHSIARSTILKSIQDNNEIYTWNIRPFDLHKNNGNVTLRKCVISKASVFGGFCEYHDRILFDKIDNEIVSFTNETLLQLHYRALCYEYFQKNVIINSEVKSRAIRKNNYINIPDIAKDYADGNILGTLDLLDEMKVCESAYITSRYEDICGVIYIFNMQTPVVCACGWIPEHSIYGDPLYDIRFNGRAPYIGFTLGNNGEGQSYFSLTFTKSNSYINEFLETISELEQSMLDIAIAFCICNSENSHINPKWWDGLKNSIRAELIESFNASLKNFGMIKPKDISKSKIINASYTVKTIKINA